MEHMAEEASAKDRTGWFKRTQWDEHLQAYPSWRLLAYAIRMPGKEEPQLQRAVQLVEELVEDAVQGLSTLSLETLRWLRSAQAQEINVPPFSCMQNPSSQLRAARLWARLICYCLRTVAAEAAEAEGEVSTLGAIARLFPWHGKQKLAATRLWELMNSNSSDSSSSSSSSERTAYPR
ncbi:uncharacterized protein M421DRAFT_10834 [Didymella exigua CBS 183.55]|uniref:Uncharacterized protein n=1 Tax=Didymella exigua CBS 183.55 TaxID=1150837 RepID=A0A6A5R213_9PLEO|nr:uncharacterized protein M421DRAFT_10834 [Didymella exigua CBS 183.55]KAF1922115.1 hypothetical protein M421DRAFT_10834 [Didymella exigua CBS 183.55]